MHREIKDLWVDALRSGKYQQGSEALCNIAENTHCCLGVLCDLYLGYAGESWTNPDDHYGLIDGQKYLLPLSVMKWAGLNTNEPRVFYDWRHRLLTELNDYNVR